MSKVCRRTGRSRRAASRDGAVTVEFAFTAPLVFLILFAALEFGRYNMIMQTATNAAFEAARHCIVPGAAASDGQTAGMSVLNAVGIQNATVTMSPTTITSTTQQVTATVSVPVGSNLWLAPLFVSTGTMTRTCTLTCDWVYSIR